MLGDITLSELFGSLQFKPITKKQHYIDLQVIKSYTTVLNFVEKLLTLDNSMDF